MRGILEPPEQAFAVLPSQNIVEEMKADLSAGVVFGEMTFQGAGDLAEVAQHVPYKGVLFGKKPVCGHLPIPSKFYGCLRYPSAKVKFLKSCPCLHL